MRSRGHALDDRPRLPASADQPTYVCLNIQSDVYPTLRNFVTHSRTIAKAAEATGIYDCGL